MTDTSVAERIRASARERILVLDGAMGTMIQNHKLQEEDYRGTQFADWNHDLKGNNDLLNITQPHIIRGIHEGFLEAGADIIETNTFNSTTISQADYAMESLVDDINFAGAQVARQAADAMTEKTPDKPRYVAGAMGPTNKTLSLSPDVNNPGYREVTFDDVADAYRQQAEGLIKGGVDMLFIETIFDTLNAKAALFAIEEARENADREVPVMISGTITDMAGRNLSGQTPSAFWVSVQHAQPLTFGLNCSFGAELLRPYVAEVSGLAETLVCAYPNAGLPNELGEYDEKPEETAAFIREWAEQGLINVIGGCCGTTPAHIRAIAETVKDFAPRKIPERSEQMQLSGLEPMMIS